MNIPLELIEKLIKAKHVVVSTGAGVSAESGIKTFRDPDGLWSKLNPAELASVDGFMSNPNRVWEWYQHRREIISSTKPNPGHYAIAEMQDLFPHFTLITQNVDRLHQQAGSKQVIELHGNIIDNHCFSCNTKYLENIDLQSTELPKCPECGGMIRPSVVWFGENLPQDAIKLAEEASSNCDIFFNVGTSSEVYPAAYMPLHAIRAGAYVVEVNPNQTAMSSKFHCRLKAPSGVALPALLIEYKKYLSELK